MEPPVLEISGLDITLPETAERPLAVEGLDLSVQRNEILCLVGESGSGKSMVAKAVLGLLPGPRVRIARGSIRLAGEEITQMDGPRLRRMRGAEAAMIFQEPMTALNPLMTVGRQVDELIANHVAMPRAERRRKVIDLFEQVHLPEPERIYTAYPHQLSGGQRQRCMIAMALSLGPSLLIADEPTTALDVTTQAQILSLIKELQQKRDTGVLFITHDFGVVAEIADRVAVMREGRVVEEAPRDTVLAAPRHPYTRTLIDAVPRLVPRARSPGVRQETALEVDGVHKQFRVGGGLILRGRVVDALRDVSLAVRQGETLGIVGESGSGKTTLARCLLRLEAPDKGAIRVGETEIGAATAQELRPVRRRIQMIFQDPFECLNMRHRVEHIVSAGPIRFGMAPDEARRRTAELLEAVGLDRGAAQRFPHEFSGGQRQRIGIARALAMDPEILVADEPVSALDVSVQAQILALLSDLKTRLKLTMVFITHDLRVAAEVCDRVAVMYRGEVVEMGTTEKLFDAPQHEYTRALLASVPGRNWESGRQRVDTVTVGEGS